MYLVFYLASIPKLSWVNHQTGSKPEVTLEGILKLHLVL